MTGGESSPLGEPWQQAVKTAFVVLVVAAGFLGLGAYGLRQVVERRVAAREEAVLQTLNALGSALEAYQHEFGGYPDSLARLGGKEEGAGAYHPPERAQLLEMALARDRFEQEGYVFTYTPAGRGQTWAATVPLVGGYVLEARPAGQVSSRMSFFFADQTRAVRVRRGAPAGPGDPLAGVSP